MLSLLFGSLLSLIFLVLARYKIRFLGLIGIICVFVLVTFNTHSNDWDVYTQIFNSDNNPFVEYGYSQLIYLLKSIGATGHSDVLCFYGLILMLSLLYIYKKVRYMTFFLLVYFVFLLPLDITQVRFGLASVFLFNSIVLFSYRKDLVACVFLILAPLFHIVSVIFCILILIVRFKLLSKYFYFIFVAFFLPSLALPILSLTSMPYIRTLSFYIADHLKVFSFISWVALTLACLLVLRYYRSHILSPLGSLSELYNNSISIITISLSLSPGLLYITDYHRIYRFTFFLIALSASILLDHLSYAMRVNLSLIVLSTALMFGLYYNQYANYDYVYWGILN